MEEKGNNDLFNPENAIRLASFGDNSAILSRKWSRALTPRRPVSVWLDSGLNFIQIGKIEMKISIANLLSWPAPFIILFNGVLSY